MSKIEVREDKRMGRAGSPDDKFRSISLPTSGSQKRLQNKIIKIDDFRKVSGKVVFPYHETHSSWHP